MHLLAVSGMGEVRPGDDVAALLVQATSEAGLALRDGDVLVIASKVVSKSEGRVVRDRDREDVVAEETRRVVSAWAGPAGRTVIAETRHGFVLAAAGVDASNTESGTLVLLPLDPDASARQIRERVAEYAGVNVGVLVSDTMGRPWREGQTDAAVGAAGVQVLDDLRGTVDASGHTLDVTVRAVADELCAAADLVAGKSGGIGAVLARGVADIVHSPGSHGAGARALVRPAAADRFRLGTREAMRAGLFGRRTVRSFTDDPVDPAAIERAVAAAMAAPAPHGTSPWRFVVVDEDARTRLLDLMAQVWAEDLRRDGIDEAAITRRLRRGDVLREAPVVVVPCLNAEGRHDYPDPRRQDAESAMFWLAMGAGVQNFLVSLSSEGLGSAWISSSLFCPAVARRALALPDPWKPSGAIAVGTPRDEPGPRPPVSMDAALLRRS